MTDLFFAVDANALAFITNDAAVSAGRRR